MVVLFVIILSAVMAVKFFKNKNDRPFGWIEYIMIQFNILLAAGFMYYYFVLSGSKQAFLIMFMLFAGQLLIYTGIRIFMNTTKHSIKKDIVRYVVINGAFIAMMLISYQALEGIGQGPIINLTAPEH